MKEPFWAPAFHALKILFIQKASRQLISDSGRELGCLLEDVVDTALGKNEVQEFAGQLGRFLAPTASSGGHLTNSRRLRTCQKKRRLETPPAEETGLRSPSWL